MTALLRADWLRLRRRMDLWIILIAVGVLSTVVFLAAYRSDATDPEYPTEAQIRQEAIDFGFFEGTPAEIEVQIQEMVRAQVESYDQQRADWESQQRFILQKYAFPQSLFTVVGSGLAPLLALILVASLAVGDEFRYGTIRTSLLAASDRRRFLAARLISLLALTVGVFVALILLAALLGLALGLVGADLGTGSATVDAMASVAWFGGLVLTSAVVIVLGVALTVVLRSGALPLLILLFVGLGELFVAHLPIFAPNELLAGVPQAFLGQNIRTLVGNLGLETHAIALSETGEMPFQALEIPMLGVAAIILAWGVLFAVLADRRLRTMDIVE